MKNKTEQIRFSIGVVLLFISVNVFAGIRLPAIFSDNMVLQQKAKVSVWGWADADEEITVINSWSGAVIQTKADDTGNWKIMIQTPKAGGPYSIKFKGKNLIELKDVLVGEVWVCSGQSNMVFSLKGSDRAKEEIAMADLPSIRYFSVNRQYGLGEFKDCPGSVWEKTSPATAPGFSAVAYYFAKKIHQQLKVPVGIVYAAWGGTPAEAWTPRAVLNKDTSLTVYFDRWAHIQQQVGKDSVAYHLALNQWEKSRVTPDSNVLKKPEEPQTLYYYKRPWREPSVLFNGMINPVIPYGVKGVLWYQGESNVSYADEYSRLFGSLIQSWRDRWNQRDLPFYFVQIAPFGYSNLDAAARLRQAQFEVSKDISQTGMVSTIDLGDMKDIHFTRKKEVGDRLALIALHKNYGFNGLTIAGPVFKNAVIQKGQVYVSFDQKLFTINQQKSAGFEIGYKQDGSDSLVFTNAQSRIEGNRIIVWNNAVQKPAIIRYAWLNVGEANLVNNKGLPALPFSEKIK